MQEALTESALEDVYVHMLRDGDEFTMTKGAPNLRYITSSTVKPITCAALLWAEHQGWFTRESLIIDLVPEFEALATNQQRNIRMKHLMSFTSGLFTTVTPSNAADWQGFVDNCASLATAEVDDDFVPGTSHFYATDQHALASVAAVNASPYADWDEYMTAFIADTGLFSGATWANQVGLIFGGNVQMSVTAQEYAAFLRAIFNETILTPTLCQDLYADAISARTASHDFLLDAGMAAEEWHFGRGIWLEQRNEDWVPAEGCTRISTIGNAGQYAYHDLTTGATLVLSATFPTNPEDFVEGLAFVRTLDALVATWSAGG